MPGYGEIGTASVRVVADGSDFQSGLERQTSATASRIGRSFATTFSRTLKVGALAAGAAVGSILTIAITKGFQRLVSLDQAKVKMQTLGLSAKGVAQAMETVKAAVKGTAYGLDEGATLATQFMAAGVKGGKELYAQLRDVAGAAAITGGSMGEIGMIWTQVAAKGRLQGDEMLQLMQRGIPVLQLLAKHYKVSTATAQEMVSKGKVDFKAFSEAMHTYVGNAALDSGKTFTGAMANLKAALGRIGQGLLGGVFAQIAPLFQRIINAMSPVEDGAARLGKKIGEVFARGVAEIESWVPTLKKVWQGIQGLYDLVVKGDFTKGLRESLGLEEDGPLIGAILNVRDKIVGAFATIKERISGLGNMLPPGLQESLPVWLGVAGAAVGVGGAFSGVSGILGRFLPMLGPLSAGLGPISGLLGGIGGVLKGVLMGPLGIVVGLFAGMYATSQPFRDALKDMLPPLADAAKALGEAFVPIVEDLARDLLPAIVAAADAFAPVLEDIAKAIGPLVETLLPPFAALADAAADSFSWLVNILGPFAPVLAGVALAIWGVNAALAASTGLMTAFSLSLVAHPIGWLILAIGALVTAFVALWQNVEGFRNFFIAVWDKIKQATAVVVNWFQTSVAPVFATVWNAIKDTVSTVLNWFTGTLWPGIQSVWDGIVSGVRGISEGISTAWSNVVSFFEGVVAWLIEWGGRVLGWITYPFKIAIALIGGILWGLWRLVEVPVMAIVNFLVEKFTIAWNWVTEVFTKIKDFIVGTWNAVYALVSMVVTAIVDWLITRWNNFVTGLIIIFTNVKNFIVGIWNAIWGFLKPIIDMIVAFFAQRWENLKTNVTTVFNAVLGFFRSVWTTISGVFTVVLATIRGIVTTAFDNVKARITTVWEGIKGLLKTGWDWISTHVFEPIKKGVDLVAKAFETAKNFIGTAWQKVQDLAKTPIKWVIDNVINRGIIQGFNFISDKIGGPHIDPVVVSGWAKGGVLPGFTPGVDVHKFYSPTAGALALSGGEAIMRPEFTRAMGGRRGIEALNRWAMRGFAKGGVFGSDAGGFGVGGSILDWIKEQASNAWGWVTDKASAIYQAVTNPGAFLKAKVDALIGGLPGGAKTMAQYGVAAVTKGITTMIDKVKELWATFTGAFSSFTSSQTVMPVNGPITANYGQYPSGGVHRGIDWGVGIGTLVKAFRAGKVNFSGWSTTGFGNLIKIAHGMGFESLYGHNSKLLKRVGDAVTAGVGVALSGSTGNSTGPHVHFEVRKNGIAVDPWPYLRGQSFDRGGLLRPGLTMAWNGTGKAERVVPDDRGYGSIIVHMNVSVDDLAKMRRIEDFIEMLERARVNSRRTLRSGVVSA